MNFSQHSTLKSFIFLMYLLFILFVGSKELIGQTVSDSVQTRVGVPLVYIDCNRCDYDYVRTELTFVNYVRDPDLADIHVFVTDVNTVCGTRVSIFFYWTQQLYRH